MLIAIGVRFYNLAGRSLWLDEVVTAKTTHINNLSDVIAQSYVDVNQMPLSYITAWLLRPWGDGEFILRLPSVIEGTLGVVAVYVLGRSLFGVRAGLIACLLTAIFPFEVWYSQEARAYALFMVLTTAQMYAAYAAAKHGGVRHWLALALFTALNLYTHYLAFFPTAAAAAYVGIFVVTDLLKGSSTRLKASVVSVLILIAFAAALTPWRQLFRVARLHVGLTAGTGALALGLVIVAAFLARRRWLSLIRARPRSTRQLALASLAGVLVAVAYIPWLPQLHTFLDRPDASIGRLQLDHSPGVIDVVNVFVKLGFSGFLLAAFCLGLGVVIFRMFRGNAAESGILVAWLGVSVLLLIRVTGASLLGIDVRYLAFLVPAVLIVIAAGIDGLVRAAERVSGPGRVSRRAANPRAAAAAGLVAVGLILLQAVPALGASFQAPKDDWRSAAQHIASSSPPGSVVFAVGDYSDWSVLCMDYYFRRLHAPITIIDGRLIDSDVAARLAMTDAAVWGMVVYPSADQMALLNESGTERTDFVDVTNHIHVLRAADRRLSTLGQARTLLHWEAQVQPQAGASAKLLDLYTGNARLGPNLLSNPPTGWALEAGVNAQDGAISFASSSTTGDLHAAVATEVQPGQVYVVTFEYTNGSLNGSQGVVLSAVDHQGKILSLYPTDAGFQCRKSSDWFRSYFALLAPAGSSQVTLMLRVSGSGTAEFRNVQLSQPISL